MKRKILFLTLFLSVFISGMAVADSINGTFEGNPIVKLFSNGKELNASEAPPIIYKDRTYVPLYMLRQIGMEVTWDGDRYAVDARFPTPLPDDKIAVISKSVGMVKVYKDGQYVGQGSGFLLQNGVFVTNSHVGAAGNKLEITLNGKTYVTDGRYLFNNEKVDIYGVQLDVSDGGIPYNAEKPKVGTHVVSISYPKGQYAVTRSWAGAVSDNHGVLTIAHFAKADLGSSGGAILNEDGQVIGVTVGGYEGSAGVEDAIPMLYVQEELNKLR